MITKMTKSEAQVMELLWKAEQPLSCSEIIEASGDKTWKDSYVHSIVKSLIKKDIVRVGGFELISRSYARKFEPAMSHDEYVLLSSFEEEDFNSADKMSGFFKAFFQYATSPELIQAIEKIIRAETK